VRQQVAHRHLAGDVGVVHLEARQVLGDRIVPGQLALVDQHRQPAAVKALELEAISNSVCHRPAAGSPSLRTPALGGDHLAILDDGNRHAGHVEGFFGRLTSLRSKAGEARAAATTGAALPAPRRC
jgi:hypothetical protein